MTFQKTSNNKNRVSLYSFLRRNNRHGRGWRGGLVRLVFMVCFVLILASTFVWGHTAVSGFIWQVFKPLALARDWTTQSLASVGAALSSNQTLIDKNNSLSEQLQEAQQKVIDRDTLYQENILLKTRYGRTDAGVQNAVLAGIIARPPQLPYDMLIVDAGSNNNLHVGDIVSVGSAVIGTVSEIYPTTARIELFSLSGKEVNGMLGGVAITTEGQGGGSMMVKLPVGIPVAIGDTVSLSNIGGGVFGIVTEVCAPTSSAIKTVYIKLPVNLFTIKFIMVDTGKNHVFITYIPELISGVETVSSTASTSGLSATTSTSGKKKTGNKK